MKYASFFVAFLFGMSAIACPDPSFDPTIIKAHSGPAHHTNCTYDEIHGLRCFNPVLKEYARCWIGSPYGINCDSWMA